MEFDYDTYVVLDLPASMAEKVISIRDNYRDWFVKSLPVEITVAGSSGVGVFDSRQDPEEALAVLDTISVYEIDKLPMSLLHRVKLLGKKIT